MLNGDSEEVKKAVKFMMDLANRDLFGPENFAEAHPDVYAEMGTAAMAATMMAMVAFASLGSESPDKLASVIRSAVEMALVSNWGIAEILATGGLMGHSIEGFDPEDVEPKKDHKKDNTQKNWKGFATDTSWMPNFD